MTRWLQAAKHSTEGNGQLERESRPGAADKPGNGVLSVKSVLSEGETIAPARPDAAGFPHGTACDMGLYPRTWTGRVVSLAAWRELTAWERHGLRGGHWSAASGEWEQPEKPNPG